MVASLIGFQNPSGFSQNGVKLLSPNIFYVQVLNKIGDYLGEVISTMERIKLMSGGNRSVKKLNFSLVMRRSAGLKVQLLQRD